jgi:hypothetical protein
MNTRIRQALVTRGQSLGTKVAVLVHRGQSLVHRGQSLGTKVAGMLAFFFGPKGKFGQNPTLKRGLIGDRSRFFTRQARTLGAQATEAFQ